MAQIIVRFTDGSIESRKVVDIFELIPIRVRLAIPLSLHLWKRSQTSQALMIRVRTLVIWKGLCEKRSISREKVIGIH
jgi:hypothetical protein